ASGGADGIVRVWDAATGREAHSLKGHISSIRHVGFSPDGNKLVSGSAEGTVKVWDLGTGREFLSIDGQQNGASRSLGFSLDGKQIVTTGPDRIVRVWDAVLGKLFPAAAEQAVVAGGRLSPDGRSLAQPEGSVIRVHRLRQPSGEEQRGLAQR